VLTYTTPLNVDNCGCEDVVGAAIADVFRAVRVLVIVASPNIDCDCCNVVEVAEAAGNGCCAAVKVLEMAPSRLDCGCKAVVVGLYTGAAAVDSTTASFPRPRPRPVATIDTPSRPRPPRPRPRPRPRPLLSAFCC
jgi:hypothetical protein